MGILYRCKAFSEIYLQFVSFLLEEVIKRMGLPVHS